MPKADPNFRLPWLFGERVIPSFEYICEVRVKAEIRQISSGPGNDGNKHTKPASDGPCRRGAVLTRDQGSQEASLEEQASDSKYDAEKLFGNSHMTTVAPERAARRLDNVVEDVEQI